MPKMHLALLIVAATLSACAHQAAVRVNCDGPLRPINHPPVIAPNGGETDPGKAEDGGDLGASHGTR